MSGFTPEERCSRSSQRCLTRQARGGRSGWRSARTDNGAHLFSILFLVFTQVS